MNEQRRGGSHKALLLLIPAAVIIAKGASRRRAMWRVRIRPRRVRRPRPWPSVPLRRPRWAIRRAGRAPASAEDRVDAAELARTRPFGGRSRGAHDRLTRLGFQHGGGRAGAPPSLRASGRRRGALPDDQLGRQLDPRLGRLLAARPCARTISAAVVAMSIERLADGRQRRADPVRDRQVVEADDAQVLRDVEPRLARGLVDARAPGGRCRRRSPSAGPAGGAARGPGRCPPRPGTCRS